MLPSVERFRLYVPDDVAVISGGCDYGVEFAACVRLGRRIEEDAPFEERAMKVGDERVEDEVSRVVDAMNSRSNAINAQFDAKIERDAKAGKLEALAAPPLLFRVLPPRLALGYRVAPFDAVRLGHGARRYGIPC